MKPIWLAFILCLGLMTSAYAQDGVQDRILEREIKGRSGQVIRIAVFVNVLPDCTGGPLPAVRLVTPPTHGTVIVKKAKLNATNVKQCLALEVPALVAFYKSAADFAGTDTTVLEIKSAQGEGRLQRYSITVSPAIPAQKI
jgi:hypothetical protein